MNVVIVDDQTSARTMLRHIIEDIGSELDVHDFGEPQAALDWCTSHDPYFAALDRNACNAIWRSKARYTFDCAITERG